MKVYRIVGFVAGFSLMSYLPDHKVSNNELWFLVGYLLAAVIYYSIEAKVKNKPVKEEIPLNREARRHPKGKAPAQKFQRVSVKGRQKQGNNRAVKGW
jgi:hypothetical protein